MSNKPFRPSQPANGSVSSEYGPEDVVIDDPSRRRAILLSVCVALMAVIAAVTGLNVAQPHLALDLKASQSEVLWMINIYAITLAAFLMPLGAVADRWGRRAVLLTGLAVFGAANVASALANGTEMMLVARALSGVGAALIMPVTLSVITSAFPRDERSKAIGIWTGVAGAGGILGMFLSAFLVDFLSWRWLFALPVALVIVSCVMCMRFIPHSRYDRPSRFDAIGSLLLALGIVGVTFVLHEGPVAGWASGAALGGLALAATAFTIFLILEQRHPAPLFDVRLFKQPGLTCGSITLVTWFGVQAGVFIVLYPFLQTVLGWSGLLATAGLMPMAILMMAFSGASPLVSVVVGPKATITAGIAFGGAGLTLMACLVSVEGAYLSVLPGMASMGIGMGLAMAPATEAITSALPQEKQSVASALNDVTRELGTSLGVALLGAVFTAAYSRAIHSVASGYPENAVSAASQNIANAALAAQQGTPEAEALFQAAKVAFVEGWRHAMWVGVAVMVLLLVVVIVFTPATLGQHQDDTKPD